MNHVADSRGHSPAQQGESHPTIRLRFIGFWDGFDPLDNYFTRLLGRRYRLDLRDDPDYVIFAYVGKRRRDYRHYDCVRIFYTGENIPPDWSACDWAFSFGHDAHPRHYRLPHWPFYVDPAALVKPSDQDPAAILARKSRFCAFVVSNPLCPTRNAFFQKLSRYKPVDSGGKLFNNLGYRVGDKQAFLRDYKFTIAFENESSPGYTTEKIVEPMLADSIPIYWGDPLVGRDFDTRSFLSAHDSRSLDDLVDRVVAVDRDPSLLLELLGRPWYRGNRVPPCADADMILEQFNRIFSTSVEPVARQRTIRHKLGVDRLPADLASLGRRVRRKWRKLLSPVP
ncbi:MAG: glycosyltransferase family 10 domain-containing protein [Planctomycetia bacterium]